MTSWRPLQTYLFWFSVCLSQAVEYTHYHCSYFKLSSGPKLFLKACCGTVNIAIPPTAALCNSFMFFKCYFIASVLESCSQRCQPCHAWPLVCDLLLSALVRWGEPSWCIEPAMQKIHRHKKRLGVCKKISLEPFMFCITRQANRQQ